MNFYIDINLQKLSIIDETGLNKLTVELYLDSSKDKLIKYIEYCAKVKYFEDKIYCAFRREPKYTPTEPEDIVIWSKYGEDYSRVKSLFTIHPDGLPIYCKSLIQEKDHIGLDSLPRRGADEEHNTETNVEWYRKIHITLIAFERKQVQDNIFKEYTSLKEELELCLKSYEIHYNNSNKDKIKLKIKCDKVRVVDNKEYYKKAILSLMLTQNNKSEILCSKVFGFRNHNEEEAEYDWGLKLYREMLYEITGVCISTILYNRITKQAN